MITKSVFMEQLRNIPEEYPNLIKKRRRKMPATKSRDNLKKIVEERLAVSASDMIDSAERLEALAKELRQMAARVDEIGA